MNLYKNDFDDIIDLHFTVYTKFSNFIMAFMYYDTTEHGISINNQLQTTDVYLRNMQTSNANASRETKLTFVGSKENNTIDGTINNVGGPASLAYISAYHEGSGDDLPMA